MNLCTGFISFKLSYDSNTFKVLKLLWRFSHSVLILDENRIHSVYSTELFFKQCFLLTLSGWFCCYAGKS